ncbi:unnamed protein product [Boreogadus saida]
MSDDMQGECFRTLSSSRRATQGPLFPPVQHLFTAAGGDPSTLKSPLCQPIAVSAGRHMAWATMIQRAIWVSHTAVPERERASLVQGPLAPHRLFGPRFSEVLAHQQSVRENLSRFGAILTGSSHQQAGRKQGVVGRLQLQP